MTIFLDLRVHSVGGDCVADARDIKIIKLMNGGESNITVDDLIQQVRGKHVLFATHGFNVDRQDGIDSLSKWNAKLTLATNTVFVAVLWPGDSAWLPVIDYPLFEMSEANRSGKLFAQFLNEHFADAASLSFVSHSLGARMVLETIRWLSDNNRHVQNLCLMAGAIDDNCLSNEYRKAAAKVDSISVLSSHGDRVLEFAFPLGNLFGSLMSRGHPYWHAALGREGPASRDGLKFHDGHWQIPDEWGYGHGAYLHPSLGPAMPLPEDLPSTLPKGPDVTSAWSAGFVSTRLSNTNRLN